MRIGRRCVPQPILSRTRARRRDAETLLACLRLGRGEGEDDELGKLFMEMAVSLEQRGVLLGEAKKRRLTQQVLCLRRQHAWLKREGDLCIEWNREVEQRRVEHV